ncbi:isoprenylcysteine carboxylmethyltransferase family protein [uncultured Cohaesibacter sp.]|uniref:methyltransferase family protein n=1 Tax=uncultured Cohaesibacter sp. TaxID=1002546 RepID=UPI00292CDCC7|nr:isoprenylcysteine carboxylmethyltransferase family protein [uncultured Cohaesibacter sp.]
MTSEQKDVTSIGVRIAAIPPLIFVLLTIVAGLLEWFVFREIKLLAFIPFWWRVALGLLIGSFSAIIMLWPWVYFLYVGTSVNPTVSASRLVTNGAFRLSRNPMYVGFVAVFVSWAVLFDSVPLLIAAGLMFLYLDRFVIKLEERQMLELFGSEFETYCNRVRRWL